MEGRTTTFSVYVGGADYLSHWESLASHWAALQGGRLLLETSRLRGGDVLSIATVEMSVAGSAGVATAGQSSATWHFGGAWHDVSVSIDRSDGCIRGNVPLATPAQLLFASDHRGRVVGNDFRWLIRWTGFELDEQGIWSYLQYGSVVAPWTVCARVNRVPCGHELDWPRFAAAPELKAKAFSLPESDGTQDAAASVSSAIDHLLEQVGPQPVLCYSGGVDSSLLALRLAELHRRDARLVSLLFSGSDPAGPTATRIARQLGFDCETVVLDESRIASFIDAIAGEYSHPFGDISCIPTTLLVRAIAESVAPGTTVIEGTGADAAFGIGATVAQWRTLYGLPAPLRSLLAAGYQLPLFWHGATPAKLESAMRALRRSAQMPFPHSVVASNALDGIAYELPSRARDLLDGTISEQLDAIARGTDDATRLSILDLMQVCAGQFAPKSYDPLRRRGYLPLYPYLHDDMLATSLALPWTIKCRAGEPKALLKSILAAKVDRELVYAPKVGFDPPFERMFTAARTREVFMGLVMSSGAWIRSFVKAKALERIADAAFDGRFLPAGSYHLLWNLLFIAAWTSQSAFSSRPWAQASAARDSIGPTRG